MQAAARRAGLRHSRRAWRQSPQSKGTSSPWTRKSWPGFHPTARAASSSPPPPPGESFTPLQNVNDPPPGLTRERSRIRTEMLARPLTRTTDMLSPTKSRLLDLALADHLPVELRSPVDDDHGRIAALTTAKHRDMPAGHHLVYLPPALRESQLLPDGTDPAQHPGPAYGRRLWAGGSVNFLRSIPMHPASHFSCSERIVDVKFKAGRAIVELSRTYRDPRPADIRPRSAYLRERRILVFFPRKDPAGNSGTSEAETPSPRVPVKVPWTPDYSFEMTPTAKLLFAFSALSHNSHAIHLDPQYSREVEGHSRGLLVQGPLTLVLLLTAMRARLLGHEHPNNGFKPPCPAGDESFAADVASKDMIEFVSRIKYRNLAPLYADEPMRVCLRRSSTTNQVMVADRYWDLWIEGPDGGLAVKAQAWTRAVDKRPRPGSRSTPNPGLDAVDLLSESDKKEDHIPR